MYTFRVKKNKRSNKKFFANIFRNLQFPFPKYLKALFPAQKDPHTAVLSYRFGKEVLMGEFFETFQMLTSPKKSNRFYNKEKSAAKAAVFHKFKNSLTCIL